MPEFRTRLINSEFDITDHGQEQESLDIASKAAILTAIAMALNGEAEDLPAEFDLCFRPAG